MKRIIVLMAVLAASFTAILVAPAVASAGCTAAYTGGAGSVQTYNSPSYGLSVVYDNGYAKANCTSTNNQRYAFQYDFQQYHSGAWHAADSTWVDYPVEDGEFKNDTTNASYQGNCINYTQRWEPLGPFKMPKNPCPNAGLWSLSGGPYAVGVDCSLLNSNTTLVRAKILVQNQTTFSESYAYSSSFTIPGTC